MQTNSNDKSDVLLPITVVLAVVLILVIVKYDKKVILENNYRTQLSENEHLNYLIFEEINTMCNKIDELLAICALNEIMPSDFTDYLETFEKYSKIYEQTGKVNHLRDVLNLFLQERNRLIKLLSSKINKENESVIQNFLNDQTSFKKFKKLRKVLQTDEFNLIFFNKLYIWDILNHLKKMKYN